MTSYISRSEQSLWNEWVSCVSPGGDIASLRASVEAARGRVEGLRDPFLPVARGDDAARAEETVLWEDGEYLVLVDRYGAAPKALVVPKREALFPVDLGEARVARLSEICRHVMEAFNTIAGGTSRAWINPPSALTVRQLHVHVQGTAPHGVPSDLNALVQLELARTLGGPTPIPLFPPTIPLR